MRTPGLLAAGGSRTKDALARAAVLSLIRAFGGDISVVDYPDIRKRAPERAGPCDVVVRVHDPAAYAEVLRNGSVGLGRSYAAGWWDTDDLVELCRLATRLLPDPDRFAGRTMKLWSRVRGDRSRSGDDRRDREVSDVRAHYDLGDDFFSMFLDPSLTYSCALFERPGMSLEEAQLAKLDRICRELDIGPGDEVLEIGSGWGSFAIHAASRYGCRVTTTTVSERQYDYVKRLIDEEELGGSVEVRRDDYRDLTGTYDKLVSIEMIEAVGWPRIDRFFAVCSERLRQHGVMALQAIVIDEALYERAKRSDDFIKAMIFPGSTIPSLNSIARSVKRSTDLRIVGMKEIGHHYVQTLAQWRQRLLSACDRIASLGFDQSLVRLWDLYLAYCQAGFAERRIGDVQLILGKTRWPQEVPG